MKRLRILCLPTGPEEYAVALVRALAAVADVDFVLPKAMLARYRDEVPATVRVHPVSWPRHRDPRNLLLLAAILRVVWRAKPDLVHFLGDSVTWLLLALPLIRCPVVVTVHDVSYHPGDTQSQTVPMATVRLLRRAASALIVHGEGLQADLVATGVAPTDGIHIVDHPVLDRHVRLAKRLGLRRRTDDRAPIVLFFGRIMAYKGLSLLIEASDQVVRTVPETKFVVAGQGPDLAHWSGELASRTWFEVRERYVPDAELAQLLLDADVLALPYLEASQSGVAALGIGAGLPIAVTAVGELGRTVYQTGNGLVTGTNPQDFATAILRLLAERSVARSNGSEPRVPSTSPLSPESVARRTLAIYDSTMECGGSDIRRRQKRDHWDCRVRSSTDGR